jgi:hypothetical protein
MQKHCKRLETKKPRLPSKYLAELEIAGQNREKTTAGKGSGQTYGGQLIDAAALMC